MSHPNPRLERLLAKRWQVAQCAVAAGVAWVIAHDVVGHDKPLFAPVAAVVSLGTTYGQRLRRVGEVTVGVAVGVFLGDMITSVVGTGAWQIGVIVALSMSAALLLDTSQLLLAQAAVQSVVVSVLVAPTSYAFYRWTDAVIGGGVALVAATVVPQAPLRRPREQAAVVLRRIVGLLEAAAAGIEDGDAERAVAVLAEARQTEPVLRELQAAADEGLSVLASSPFRVRHAIGVRRMADLVEPLDYALRNTRVLVRRVAVAAHRHEPMPRGYAVLVRELAGAAQQVAEELDAGRLPETARPALLAVGWASTEVDRLPGLSAEVVLAQVRSIVADLLAVSGLDPMAATDQIPPLT